ncbi:MAG TPA: hypothetical protein VHE78_11910 [Gemmatimonadaceae bacterium]|nr:hypothetical protein [Gemmatimonadaceae bacterium]
MTVLAVPMHLSSRELIRIAAGAIEPLLNRVVFSGRHVAGYLMSNAAGAAYASTFTSDDTVRVLSAASPDRVAADLQRLGLARGTRTAASEQWRVDDRVTIDLTHVPGDEGERGAIWLEYASLLTMPVAIHDGDKQLNVRITGAPALLALDWSAYLASGETPHDSGELADIVALVAARAELVGELGTSPPELRDFVGGETRRFLKYDGAEHVIRAALPNENRSAAMVQRVAERLGTMAA